MSCLATLFAGTAWAEAPRVSVDIAPLHSLVARVMEGVGVPSLIVDPGASPHDYRLRPSQAAALQDADVVVWLGDILTPSLEDAIKTLAGTAEVLTLIDVDGTEILPFREMAVFDAHDTHDDKEHGHDDHGHGHSDGHSDGHGAEKDHADAGHHDKAHDHDHDDEHDHDGADPHAWLSPDNAAHWLTAIAETLAQADPDNADVYAANAVAGRAELTALKVEITETLAPVRGNAFVVFHDAYQYFETAFDMPAAGAISMSDAARPSPARIAQVQARMHDNNIRCILAEPQFNAGLVATVTNGTAARAGVLDPLGVGLDTGSALYPQLMRGLANELATCLGNPD